MGPAGRSCVRTKKFAFMQQIDQFPWWIRRGIYISPKYYCEADDCNWTLVITRNLGYSTHNNGYIAMSLRREEYNNKYLSTDVSLIVVDSFKICSIYAFKEIYFTPYFHEDVVLRMTRSDLFGYFGLNKLRFMLNDILSVKCEIIIKEIVEVNYVSEDELEDTTKYVKRKIFKFILIPLCVAAVVGSSYICFRLAKIPFAKLVVSR